MTIQDLVQAMETIAPQSLAEEWDNVGLLVGDRRAPLTTAVVTLDITAQAVAFAKEVGAQVIVAHHPLIFSPVKRMQAPSALYTLATSGIAAFAAHTNLDKATGGVNDTLADMIGLENVEPAFDHIGRVGELKEPLSPDAFAALVKDRLHTPVRFRAGTKAVRTVGLVSGAGGDFAARCEADAFLTGEIKHHEWLELPEELTVVDAGHYATENIVLESLASALAEQLPTLNIHEFHASAPYITF